jgi:hypothetical protein
MLQNRGCGFRFQSSAPAALTTVPLSPQGWAVIGDNGPGIQGPGVNGGPTPGLEALCAGRSGVWIRLGGGPTGPLPEGTQRPQGVAGPPGTGKEGPPLG